MITDEVRTPNTDLEMIRKRLDVLRAGYELYGDKNRFIRIEPEDNVYIYKAIHSGDKELRDLAITCAYGVCRELAKTDARAFLAATNTEFSEDDVEDMVSELLKTTLTERIDLYDCSKGSLVKYVRNYEKNVFSRERSQAQPTGGTRHERTVGWRVKNAMKALADKGNMNPSAYDIYLQDKETGSYSRDLSIKSIEQALEVVRVSNQSLEVYRDASKGNDARASEEYDPFLAMIQKEKKLEMERALMKMRSSDYRRIIMFALDINITDPDTENRELIEYTRNEIICNEDSTRDDAKMLIFAAFRELSFAMGSSINSHSRRRKHGRVSFSDRRREYELEEMDIMQTLEDDLTALD